MEKKIVAINRLSYNENRSVVICLKFIVTCFDYASSSFGFIDY